MVFGVSPAGVLPPSSGLGPSTQKSADAALVDDGGDEHAIGLLVIEDHMPRVLVPPGAGREFIGLAAQLWVLARS